MSNYKNALSLEKIEQFQYGGNKVRLSIGNALNGAFEYCKANVGTVILCGLVILLLLFLSPWLIAGLMIGIYNERVNGQKLEVSSLFKGFDHFVPILMYFLIYVGISIILSFIPGIIQAAAGDSTALQMVAAIVNIAASAISFILGGLLFFSIFFIVFAGMDGMQAIRASINVAKKNLVNVLIFALVVGLVAGLGVIACGIGVLFTYPLAMIAQYLGMSEVFGIEDKDKADDILQHLV